MKSHMHVTSEWSCFIFNNKWRILGWKCPSQSDAISYINYQTIAWLQTGIIIQSCPNLSTNLLKFILSYNQFYFCFVLPQCFCLCQIDQHLFLDNHLNLIQVPLSLSIHLKLGWLIQEFEAIQIIYAWFVLKYVELTEMITEK